MTLDGERLPEDEFTEAVCPFDRSVNLLGRQLRGLPATSLGQPGRSSSIKALLDRAERLGLASRGASATILGSSDRASTRSVTGREVQGQVQGRGQPGGAWQPDGSFRRIQLRRRSRRRFPDGPSTRPCKPKKKSVIHPMPFGLDRLAGSQGAGYPLKRKLGRWQIA